MSLNGHTVRTLQESRETASSIFKEIVGKDSGEWTHQPLNTNPSPGGRVPGSQCSTYALLDLRHTVQFSHYARVLEGCGCEAATRGVACRGYQMKLYEEDNPLLASSLLALAF